MCTCARGWLAVLAVLSTPLGCHGEDESLPTRIASFMVIGDWGWDRVAHGNVQSSNCQRIIANRMHQEFNDLGDVKFVINVGDSFYPGGVSSKQDQQWHSKWRSRYSPSLRSVPWYSVYGNHDMLYDPGACSSEEDKAAQINYDVADLDHFFMPGFSWYFQHEDLDLEVLALDLWESVASRLFCLFRYIPPQSQLPQAAFPSQAQPANTSTRVARCGVDVLGTLL